MEVKDYIARVPWQHRKKPRFKATLESILNPFVRMGFLLDKTPELYDVDTASGGQLDVDGAWVGRGRFVDSPLDGIYFEWNATKEVGWNAGQWKGTYDPTSGLVALDDDTYRALIKLQIVANIWDGTGEKAYTAWDATFEDSKIIIEDHQDMTVTIGIAGKMQSTAQQALFTQQISPFKAMGVRVKVYFISKVDAPLFAWGLENDTLAGWGVGAWAEKFVPPVTTSKGRQKYGN